MISFRPLDAGRVLAHVESAEAELLSNLIGQVAALVEERSTDVGRGTAVGPDLGDSEAALLSSLEASLEPLPDPRDEVLARLFPDGRRGAEAGSRDPRVEADAEEFRRLTEHDLRDGKLADARSALASLSGDTTTVELSDDEAVRLLRALNDVRLALGARLQVTEETPYPRRVRDEKDQALRIYYWTGGVQDELLAALSASGPVPPG